MALLENRRVARRCRGAHHPRLRPLAQGPAGRRRRNEDRAGAKPGQVPIGFAMRFRTSFWAFWASVSISVRFAQRTRQKCDCSLSFVRRPGRPSCSSGGMLRVTIVPTSRHRSSLSGSRRSLRSQRTRPPWWESLQTGGRRLRQPAEGQVAKRRHYLLLRCCEVHLLGAEFT